VNTGTELTDAYKEQNSVINKLIRELKCAKHDEKNLNEMLRDCEQRLTQHQNTLETEMKLNNCLLKEIRDIEYLRGSDLLPSTCQESSACFDESDMTACVSNPTLSTTFLYSDTSCSKLESGCSSSSSSCDSLSSLDCSEVECYEKLNILPTTAAASPTSSISSLEDDGSVEGDSVEA